MRPRLTRSRQARGLSVSVRSRRAVENLAEVTGRFVRDGHDALLVLRRLASSRIEIVPFSAADATLAASLIPRTQALRLSLGDRACLALALARGIPAVTADRCWSRLEIGVAVTVIR